jgi:hypothetical protein
MLAFLLARAALATGVHRNFGVMFLAFRSDTSRPTVPPGLTPRSRSFWRSPCPPWARPGDIGLAVPTRGRYD